VAEADADRFTRIYREAYPRVLGYALRHAAADAAREAVAETFLVAWRRLADVPEPALPWLLVVTRNVIADQRRGGRHADVLLAEVERLAATHPDVSEEVVERHIVLRAAAALPEADREALLLTVWDCLGNRAAATVAGCSIGAFAVRLHRARRRLRDELARLDDNGVPVAPTTRREVG
jgi:RNA polymerase sigma-70 factor (ECF subfamily)